MKEYGLLYLEKSKVFALEKAFWSFHFYCSLMDNCISDQKQLIIQGGWGKLWILKSEGQILIQKNNLDDLIVRSFFVT